MPAQGFAMTALLRCVQVIYPLSTLPYLRYISKIH